jgi:DNA-binding NarL/FixJ family response regulator
MKDETIYVSIVDDDQVIREGLASLLNGTDGYQCVGAYPDCETAIKDLEENLPDVILMDIELPGMSGIEGTHRIKQKHADMDIVVLTVHDDDELVFKALCEGACGYLIKSEQPAKLLESIKEVYHGGAPMSTSIARMVIRSFQKSTESPLSERETEVLELMSKGKSYKMIADQLFINKETVRSHIKNIYRKLEVNSKAEAIEKALKDKLI